MLPLAEIRTKEKGTMTARTRIVPNWIYVLFVLFFIALCTRLLVQLPPASEASHAFVKHGWASLRSYMNVAASNPNDFGDGEGDEGDDQVDLEQDR